MKKLSKRGMALVLCILAATTGARAQPQVLVPAPTTAPATAIAQATPPGKVQQLVAPIALYPDALVGQILAASTYPTQVVQAARWLRQQPALKDQALADAVDQQPWDPSVKALTQFPTVLANMSRNLSWTSALGDAYLQDQQATLAAVQALRQRAQAAGNLASSAAQTVTTQDQAIAIDPVDPELVTLPAYDPWLAYGAPIAAYPGWYDHPGLFYPGTDLYWGAAGIGLFAGLGWGWNHWGSDWHHGRVTYNHAPYISHGHGSHGEELHVAGGPGFHGGHFAGSGGFHAHGGEAGFGGGFHGAAIGAVGPHFGGMHAGLGSGMHGGFHGGGGMHGGGFGGGGHGGGGHR